jgi:hypothetical protein
MNKKIFIKIYLLFCVISACSKNENSTSTLELSGTHWVKTTDEKRHFTFTTASEYVYVELGRSYTGTYSFNGTNGPFIDVDKYGSIDFKVNSKILSVNQDVTNPDFESIYEKQ